MLLKGRLFNILYIVADIETRHATSLLMAKSHFDTPSISVYYLFRQQRVRGEKIKKTPGASQQREFH